MIVGWAGKLCTTHTQTHARKHSQPDRQTNKSTEYYPQLPALLQGRGCGCVHIVI
jgi:hypothetical protein